MKFDPEIIPQFPFFLENTYSLLSIRVFNPFISSDLHPPTPPHSYSRTSHETHILLNIAELLANVLVILNTAVHEGFRRTESRTIILSHDDLSAGIDGRQRKPLRVPGGIDGLVTGQVEDLRGKSMEFGQGDGDVGWEGHEGESLYMNETS